MVFWMLRSFYDITFLLSDFIHLCPVGLSPGTIAWCYCGAQSEKPTDITICFTMRLLLLVCVHTILMASGICLQCQTCSQFHEQKLADCDGASVKCHLNQVCMVLSMSTFYILNNRLIRSNIYIVRRACWEMKSCYVTGKLSSPSHKMLFSTDCCSTDDCKAPIPKLPLQNNTHNGLVCPAASTFVEKKYKPTYAMKCTGDETYCFEFKSNSDQDAYIAGCGSYRYCSLRAFISEFYREKPYVAYANGVCRKANKTISLPVANSLLCPQSRGSVGFSRELFDICSKENDACVTIISRTTYGQRQNTELLRRCGFSSECDRAGTITSAQKSISRNTTCCYTDHCFAPIPSLPLENNETNGLICESCYLREYGSCSGIDRIACTGNATRCISYTERVIDGNSESKEVLHGCTHPSLCDRGNITASYDNKIIQETKICQIPSKSSLRLPNIPYATVLFVIWSKFMLNM